MEKELNQKDNCCGEMLKGETPKMHQMMNHMQEFMGKMKNEEKEKDESEKKSSTLDSKEKELVMVGASIAAGCKPCTKYHVKKALEVGLSKIDIRIAIENAYEIRLKAAKIMLSHGLNLLEIDEDIKNPETDYGEIRREEELVAIAASYAVNCTSSLEEHISRGKEVGIGDNEITEIAELVAFIQKKAKSHVDKIIPNSENGALQDLNYSKNMCC
jgi:AhpD family alkylhydroperoxidase